MGRLFCNLLSFHLLLTCLFVIVECSQGVVMFIPYSDYTLIIFLSSSFRLTGANVDDRDGMVWTVFAKVLYGKVFADRGYTSRNSSRACSVKVSNLFMGSRLR